jgi:hypothetical protein
MTLDPDIATRLKRNADGLFTAIVQERGSGCWRLRPTDRLSLGPRLLSAPPQHNEKLLVAT